jgi:hypothetical protein
VNDVRDGELQRLGRRRSLRNAPAERTANWKLTALRSNLLRQQGGGGNGERSNNKDSDAEVTNHSTVAPQKTKTQS